MTQTEQRPSAEITQELETRFQTGFALKASSREKLKQLDQIATTFGAKGYPGKVAFAGQSLSGNYYVQFNVNNGGGYSSTWPQWAFELAKLALLNGKPLYVIANGDPFGSYLVQVLLFP